MRAPAFLIRWNRIPNSKRMTEDKCVSRGSAVATADEDGVSYTRGATGNNQHAIRDLPLHDWDSGQVLVRATPAMSAGRICMLPSSFPDYSERNASIGSR